MTLQIRINQEKVMHLKLLAPSRIFTGSRLRTVWRSLLYCMAPRRHIFTGLFFPVWSLKSDCLIVWRSHRHVKRSREIPHYHAALRQWLKSHLPQCPSILKSLSPQTSFLKSQTYLSLAPHHVSHGSHARIGWLWNDVIFNWLNFLASGWRFYPEATWRNLPTANNRRNILPGLQKSRRNVNDKSHRIWIVSHIWWDFNMRRLFAAYIQNSSLW